MQKVGNSAREENLMNFEYFYTNYLCASLSGFSVCPSRNCFCLSLWDYKAVSIIAHIFISGPEFILEWNLIFRIVILERCIPNFL